MKLFLLLNGIAPNWTLKEMHSEIKLIGFYKNTSTHSLRLALRRFSSLSSLDGWVDSLASNAGSELLSPVLLAADPASDATVLEDPEPAEAALESLGPETAPSCTRNSSMLLLNSLYL